MLATQLLEQQHRDVEALFSRLEKQIGDKEACAETLAQLANSLAAHMTIEQELLYPNVENLAHDQIFESYEEHALAEIALKRLLASDPRTEAFKARITALKELIQHHVHEEESELFPALEDHLDDAQLQSLGQRMQDRFEDVVAGGYAAVLPPGIGKTSADLSKKLIKSAREKRKRAA
jgi:hemerythrin-like domain-containing protein